MYDIEAEVGTQAVLAASVLTQKVFHKLVKSQILTKSDKTPVTVVDLSSQSLISLVLSEAFPDIPLVGEEDADDLHSEDKKSLRDQIVDLVNESLEESALKAGRTEKELLTAIDRGNYAGGKTTKFWTCDPIDGTKGFVRGEQYAICLALIDEGVVVLSITSCPNLLVDPLDETGKRGVLFVAQKGRGAYSRTLISPTRTQLSIPKLSPSGGIVESFEPEHTDQVMSAKVAESLGITAEPHRLDSQAKYCEVARGVGALYFRVRLGGVFQEKIWDHACGNLLIEESGGSCFDPEGKSIDFGQGRTFDSLGIFGCHKGDKLRVLAAVRKAKGLESQ